MIEPYYEEPNIKIYCGDCLTVMKQFPDKSFDLVLTDPPYGFLNNTKTFGSGKGKSMAKPRRFDIQWDTELSKEVFDEIFRISKNQIIFGFEHYAEKLPKSRGIICWDKKRPPKTAYSEFELIYTSFDKPTRFFRYTWHGMIKQGNDKIIHPTQKPVVLMEYLIKTYTNKTDTILDPFLGSGTTLVACKELERRGIGIEISKEYCDIAIQRLKNTMPNLL